MANTTSSHAQAQHSLLKSLGLHLLPGVLVTAAFLLLKPLSDSIGYPPLIVFLLTVLVIDLPIMLGVMLYEGKQLNGRYNLRGVILFREKIPWKTFVGIFAGAFVVLYLVTIISFPITNFLTAKVFSGLPAWIFLDEQSQYTAFAKNILVTTAVVHLFVTGIFLPWVEELYFRGFLLPRISRFSKWAPILGGLFFGLYHVWQPYGFVTVFLLGVGLGYVVWWKKDLRLSITLHIFANVLARLMFLIAALTM